MPLNIGAALGAGLQSASDTNQQINAQRLKEKAVAQSAAADQSKAATDAEKARLARVKEQREVEKHAMAVEKSNRDIEESRKKLAIGNKEPIQTSGVMNVELPNSLQTHIDSLPVDEAGMTDWDYLNPDQREEMRATMEASDREIIDAREMASIQKQGKLYLEAGIFDEADAEAFEESVGNISGQEQAAFVQQQMEAAKTEWLKVKETERLTAGMTLEAKAMTKDKQVPPGAREQVDAWATIIELDPTVSIADKRELIQRIKIEVDPDLQYYISGEIAKGMQQQAMSLSAQSQPGQAVPVEFGEHTPSKDPVAALGGKGQIKIQRAAARIGRRVENGAITFEDGMLALEKMMDKEGVPFTEENAKALLEAVNAQL